MIQFLSTIVSTVRMIIRITFTIGWMIYSLATVISMVHIIFAVGLTIWCFFHIGSMIWSSSVLRINDLLLFSCWIDDPRHFRHPFNNLHLSTIQLTIQGLLTVRPKNSIFLAVGSRIWVFSQRMMIFIFSLSSNGKIRCSNFPNMKNENYQQDLLQLAGIP